MGYDNFIIPLSRLGSKASFFVINCSWFRGGEEDGEEEEEGPLDAPELMDSANTLTNPQNFDKKKERSSDEL